jgi:MoxR-like ATPase
MEIEIAPEDTIEIHRRLMFDARFHDTDALIAGMTADMIDHRSLPAVGAMIQAEIRTGAAVETFVDHLRRATHDPRTYGIALEGVDMDDLIATGASPRGMSMLVRAAKVSAWLDGATDLTPEHLRDVFHEVIAHRVFFTPIYELQRGRIGREFTSAVLRAVPAP